MQRRMRHDQTLTVPSSLHVAKMFGSVGCDTHAFTSSECDSSRSFAVGTGLARSISSVALSSSNLFREFVVVVVVVVVVMS